MKLCSPKNILVALIILFLIFNSIFFFNYLLNLNQKDSIEKNTIDTEANILKSIVNFNFTSFISHGFVHFFYPANKKVKFLFLEDDNRNRQNGQNKINGNNTDISEKSKECEIFFDQDELKFVDSNNKICDSIKFDFKTNCCKDSPSNYTVNMNSFGNFTNIYSKDCDTTSKCCKNEYLCISYCLYFQASGLNTNNIYYFKECKNNCKLRLITKYYKLPYCSFTKKDISNNMISLVYTKKNLLGSQSCSEVCQEIKKTCYNHILLLFNDCKYLSNCSQCIVSPEFFGPAIKSQSGLCFISNKHLINCDYSNNSIERLCACI